MKDKIEREEGTGIIYLDLITKDRDGEMDSNEECNAIYYQLYFT